MKRIEHIFTDSIYHSVDKNLEIEDKLIKELEENKFWHRKSSMGGYQKNLTTCKEPFFKMIKHHGQEYPQVELGLMEHMLLDLEED